MRLMKMKLKKVKNDFQTVYNNLNKMNTLVKITRFKSTGKWLETFEDNVTLPIFENVQIQELLGSVHGYLKNENYVMELTNKEEMFNSRLILNNK